MTSNSYDKGRLNLPFVGICTFGKYPYQESWDKINADVAILGAPFDFGSQFRSGARMGPRGIRESSTLFSFGHAGAYDHEDDITYLPSETTNIVDLGDADIIHTDTIKSHENIKYGVQKILQAKAIPIILGCDHSVNIPCIDAIIQRGEVIGMDLVEVAPDYDLTFSTSTLAAQLLMNAIGRILHYKIK